MPFNPHFQGLFSASQSWTIWCHRREHKLSIPIFRGSSLLLLTRWYVRQNNPFSFQSPFSGALLCFPMKVCTAILANTVPFNPHFQGLFSASNTDWQQNVWKFSFNPHFQGLFSASKPRYTLSNPKAPELSIPIFRGSSLLLKFKDFLENWAYDLSIPIFRGSSLLLNTTSFPVKQLSFCVFQSPFSGALLCFRVQRGTKDTAEKQAFNPHFQGLFSASHVRERQEKEG